RRGGCKSGRHQPFAMGEKSVETLNEVAGIHAAKQFDVVGPEHDAVIAGALPDMAAARGQREAETAPTHARKFEIPHPDDDMINPRYGPRHPLFPSHPPPTGRAGPSEVRAATCSTCFIRCRSGTDPSSAPKDPPVE